MSGNLKEVPKKKEAPKGGGIVTEKVEDKEYTLEVIKDYDGKIDPFYLSNKDPEYEYRFLRDDPKNINIKTSNMLFQKGGWQICPKTHCVRIGVKDTEISPDGLCRRGDQILAFMPKKLFREKQEQKWKEANDPMDAITKMIGEGDPNNPSLVGLGHDTQRGIQTQRDLGMK